jgi:RNA polymerase sigma factor (TIGR02999 family)
MAAVTRFSSLHCAKGAEVAVSEPDPTPAAFPSDAPVDAVFGVVYERLKGLASRQLARGARGTLDTTALVHELYLRVNTGRDLAFEHPAQFFAYAARAMRHLLADRARDRMRQKAGGDWVRITLTGNDSLHPAIESAEQALSIEEALTRLEQQDARAARVVELRWFAGLDPEQVADVLQVTRRTVDRDWRYARAFLHATLE